MPTSTRVPDARQRLPWWRGLVALLAVAILGAAMLVSQADRIRAGAEAYLYGYPLVIMDLTRAQAALAVGPENQLRRVRRFPDANFKGVVRPNVDTLYTTAFIDIARGPWVFEMAANDQRYEVMPFMDAWTNVFAAPGTRVSGTAGGKYLLVGSAWQGTVPQGMSLLRSPTRIVWLIGRTQTNGTADYPLVHRLQDGLSLRRLTEGIPADPAWRASDEPARPPLLQMQAMSTEAFFTRLAALMVENPPAAADAAMQARLSSLGIMPGQALRWGPLERWFISLGRWVADLKVARELKKPRQLVRGWSTPPANLGQYGTDYATRAAVAMVGLGANLPADAIYPNAKVDAQGAILDGSHRYRLHFQAGELPPVLAFWSVTAYGADDYLIDNPLHRHALGDRDPLAFNADGSLDLWLQADAPPADRRSNWLPVKAGAPFLLNARLYRPKQEALTGAWNMPAVERLD
jgi:hypothetical protein